jgi:hypothetical protein
MMECHDNYLGMETSATGCMLLNKGRMPLNGHDENSLLQLALRALHSLIPAGHRK